MLQIVSLCADIRNLPGQADIQDHGVHADRGEPADSMIFQGESEGYESGSLGLCQHRGLGFKTHAFEFQKFSKPAIHKSDGGPVHNALHPEFLQLRKDFAGVESGV